MKCESCNTDNRPDRRFCSQCGASLPSGCAHCGFINEAGARFCGGCGRPGESLPRSSPPDSGKASEAPDDLQQDSAGERRQITVLFCDLADSTAMSTRLDPEDLSRINQIYQDTCTSIITSFHGTVARYMGDGILCYFGYPQASENDAENAIRAALEIQRTMVDVSVQGAFDEVLRVRVGIASGPVIVGAVVGEGAARESTAVGKTPNLAARLQSVCEPGTTAVSDETKTLAGDHFEYEHLGQFELKGFDGRSNVWKVTSVKRTSSRFEAIAGLNLTPLVGRAHELELIKECWGDTRKGRGHVILLSGEPGIGKSRMTRAVLDHADTQNYRVLQCSPYHQARAFYPVIEEMKQQRDDQHLATQQWLEAEFDRRRINDADAVQVFMQFLDPGVELTGASSAMPASHIKRRTLELLLAWYCPAESEAAAVLIVEDLHWIDPSTQQFIDMLVHRISDRPLLLIVSFRPGYTPSAVDYPNVHLMALNRIDREPVKDMIRNLLGADVPDTLIQRIIDRTDGIPLFVEELSRTIKANGHLGQDQDFDVPATLADSLNARLDSLGDARRTAQAGSIIGRAFERPLLSAITRIDDELLDQHLERMVRSGLVFRFGTGETATYQFKHALIQDAAYSGLLRERRQRFHRRAALFLDRSEDTSGKQPDILAVHYEHGALTPKALENWCRAGQLALSQSATSEALLHFNRALKLLSKADTDDTTGVELSIHLGLAACFRFKEQYQDALDSLARAEALAVRLAHTEALSDICNLRGNIYFPLGDLEGCLAEHGRSLDFARQVDSLEKQARAIGGLGDGYYVRGEMKAAARHFIRCCDMSAEHGFIVQNAANRAMIGWSRLYELDMDRTLNDALEAIELCAQCGHLRAQMNAESLAANVCGEMNEPSEARIHSEKARDLARKIGAVNFEAAIVYFERRFTEPESDKEHERQLLHHAAERSRELGHGFHGPAILGGLLRLTYDPDERRAICEEAEKTLDSGCVGHNHYWFYRDAIDAALYFQEWDRLERYTQKLIAFDGSEQSNWVRYFTQRAQVVKACVTGQVDQRTEQLRESLIEEGNQNKLIAAVKLLESVIPAH